MKIAQDPFSAASAPKMCVFSLLLGPQVSADYSPCSLSKLLRISRSNHPFTTAATCIWIGRTFRMLSLPPSGLPLGLSSCSLPHISTLMLASLEVFCLLPKTINTTNVGVGGQKKHEERKTCVIVSKYCFAAHHFGKICYSLP